MVVIVVVVCGGDGACVVRACVLYMYIFIEGLTCKCSLALLLQLTEVNTASANNIYCTCVG